ncbi:rCG36247 [Rattus norvegicus]|uniref:RCG36247 n=1 Tax=Rattus norvegicus TaxID=10116 RepID=A6IPV2_RAT|nr:rCG36247 [Rattus norvegicus]
MMGWLRGSPPKSNKYVIKLSSWSSSVKTHHCALSFLPGCTTAPQEKSMSAYPTHHCQHPDMPKNEEGLKASSNKGGDVYSLPFLGDLKDFPKRHIPSLFESET